jgi:magnesium-transporting ATPase (P-type)
VELSPEEAHLQITRAIGLRRTFWRSARHYLFCVLFSVLYAIFWAWFPGRFYRFRFQSVPLQHAEWVYVSDGQQRKTLCAVEMLREVCDYEVEAGERDGSGAAAMHVDDIPLHARMIVFRNRRFAFSPESGEFELLRPPATVAQGELLAGVAGHGLSLEDFGVRATTFGKNLMCIPIPSVFGVAVAEVLSPFFVFQIYSVILWCFETYYIFAAVIGVMATCSLGMTVYDTRAALVSLRELARSDSALTVIRGGRRMLVASTDLVVGDVAVLSEPIDVPCDLALLTGAVVVNEAMLTGESVPVVKTPIVEPPAVLTAAAAAAPIEVGKDSRTTLFAGSRIMQIKPPVGAESLLSAIPLSHTTTSLGLKGVPSNLLVSASALGSGASSSRAAARALRVPLTGAGTAVGGTAASGSAGDGDADTDGDGFTLARGTDATGGGSTPFAIGAGLGGLGGFGAGAGALAGFKRAGHHHRAGGDSDDDGDNAGTGAAAASSLRGPGADADLDGAAPAVLAYVVRTGFATSKGNMLSSMLFPPKSTFEFEQQAYKFLGFLFSLAAIGFGLTIWRYYLISSPVSVMLLRALDLATIVVPPSLPLAMSIGTSFSILCLKAYRIYCIAPSRINLAGRVKLMCFDKTGTLTTDSLRFRGVHAFVPLAPPTQADTHAVAAVAASVASVSGANPASAAAQAVAALAAHGGARAGLAAAAARARDPASLLRGDAALRALTADDATRAEAAADVAGLLSPDSTRSNDVPIAVGDTSEFTFVPSKLPPAVRACLATCHSLTLHDGAFIGDPLEIEGFGACNADFLDSSLKGVVFHTQLRRHVSSAAVKKLDRIRRRLRRDARAAARLGPGRHADTGFDAGADPDADPDADADADASSGAEDGPDADAAADEGKDNGDESSLAALRSRSPSVSSPAQVHVSPHSVGAGHGQGRGHGNHHASLCECDCHYYGPPSASAAAAGTVTTAAVYCGCDCDAEARTLAQAYAERVRRRRGRGGARTSYDIGLSGLPSVPPRAAAAAAAAPTVGDLSPAHARGYTRIPTVATADAMRPLPPALVELAERSGRPIETHSHGHGHRRDDAEDETKSASAANNAPVRGAGAEGRSWSILKQFPFESSLQRMGVFALNEYDMSLYSFVKGAPEMVARRCDPATVPASYHTTVDWYTNEGHRVIAIAAKPVSLADLDPSVAAAAASSSGRTGASGRDAPLLASASLLSDLRLETDNGAGARPGASAGPGAVHCEALISGGAPVAASVGEAVSAVATALSKRDFTEVREFAESGLTLLGLVVMENALKPATTGTLAALQAAAVRCVMVTGDNVKTAVSISKECGIVAPDTAVFVSQVPKGAGATARDIRWVHSHLPHLSLDPYTFQLRSSLAPASSLASSVASALPFARFELAVTGDAYALLLADHVAAIEAEARRLDDAADPLFAAPILRGAASGSGVLGGGGGGGGSSTPPLSRSGDGIHALRQPAAASALGDGIAGGGVSVSARGGGGVDSPASTNSGAGGFSAAEAAARLGLKDPENYALAATSFEFPQLREERRATLLQRVVLAGAVFARMTPDQKAGLVSHYMALGMYTGMCGDGANDCGALKTAHIGVSLAESEASIAAPFTSQISDISCVPLVLCQGRSALATAFQLFRYMGLYSVIQFGSCILLYFKGGNFCDYQFLYQDLFAVFPLALVMGRTPAATELTPKRPPSDLLSKTNIFSIVVHMIFALGFQLLAYKLTALQPDYVSYPNEDYYCELWEATIIHYYVCMQYVLYAIIFSIARPWKQWPWRNPGLLLTLLVSLGCTLTFFILGPRGFFLMQDDMPIPLRWKLEVLLLFAGNCVVAALVEFGVMALVDRCADSRKAAERTHTVYGKGSDKIETGARPYHIIRRHFEDMWPASQVQVQLAHGGGRY